MTKQIAFPKLHYEITGECECPSVDEIDIIIKEDKKYHKQCGGFISQDTKITKVKKVKNGK